jgi:hypothetical protein
MFVHTTRPMNATIVSGAHDGRWCTSTGSASASASAGSEAAPPLASPEMSMAAERYRWRHHGTPIA